jgi:hypothetical protein
VLPDALREAGAEQQAVRLAARAAANVVVNDRAAITRLLHAIREAGADQSTATLLNRLSAAGMFGLFLTHTGQENAIGLDVKSTGAQPPHGTGASWTDRIRPLTPIACRHPSEASRNG